MRCNPKDRTPGAARAACHSAEVSRVRNRPEALQARTGMDARLHPGSVDAAMVDPPCATGHGGVLTGPTFERSRTAGRRRMLFDALKEQLPTDPSAPLPAASTLHSINDDRGHIELRHWMRMCPTRHRVRGARCAGAPGNAPPRCTTSASTAPRPRTPPCAGRMLPPGVYANVRIPDDAGRPRFAPRNAACRHNALWFMEWTNTSIGPGGGGFAAPRRHIGPVWVRERRRLKDWLIHRVPRAQKRAMYALWSGVNTAQDPLSVDNAIKQLAGQFQTQNCAPDGPSALHHLQRRTLRGPAPVDCSYLVRVQYEPGNVLGRMRDVEQRVRAEEGNDLILHFDSNEPPQDASVQAVAAAAPPRAVASGGARGLDEAFRFAHERTQFCVYIQLDRCVGIVRRRHRPRGRTATKTSDTELLGPLPDWPPVATSVNERPDTVPRLNNAFECAYPFAVNGAVFRGDGPPVTPEPAVCVLSRNGAAVAPHRPGAGNGGLPVQHLLVSESVSPSVVSALRPPEPRVHVHRLVGEPGGHPPKRPVASRGRHRVPGCAARLERHCRGISSVRRAAQRGRRTARIGARTARRRQRCAGRTSTRTMRPPSIVTPIGFTTGPPPRGATDRPRHHLCVGG